MNRVALAKKTAGAIRAGQAAKTSALAANGADKEKLQRLADEIATLDARLDPEDLGAIQMLATKRDQHSRLSTKFAADADARLSAVDAALSAALDGGKLAEIFRAEYAPLLESIADTLRPFVTDRARALQIAQTTDAARAVWRLSYVCANNPFQQALPAAEIVAALEGMADGKPTWIQP